MAANNDLQIEENSGKSKKLLLIGIVAVVLLAAAGAYFFLFAPTDKTGTADEDITQPAAVSVSAPAVSAAALYVSLPRPFVFNVPGRARDRLVQIKVELLVRGSGNENLAKRHIPLIEGSLLKTFASANADELATIAGKEALKAKALTDLQNDLANVVGNTVVEEVLFTGFVMQ